MTKISIRFYNDHEVRALWDEDNSKWWFSVLDIIGAINNQDDYQKNRNYWKYLKTKLKKENNELVSLTNQLKLVLIGPIRSPNFFVIFSTFIMSKASVLKIFPNQY